MWIWMRKGILIFHPDMNPDPDPHPNKNPDPHPDWHKKSESASGSNFSPWNGSGYRPYCSFQIKAQTLKKCSNRLIFHTFRLVICKLMRAVPDPAYHFDAKYGSWFLFDVDPDPDFYLMRIQVTQWCGSMRIRIHNTACKCTVQTDCGEHATYMCFVCAGGASSWFWYVNGLI
jgi:hypothetical protein